MARPGVGPGARGPLPRRSRGPWLWLGAGIGVLTLLPLLAVAALDLRLRAGPMDAGFLTGQIESAINERAAPLRVKIGTASLRFDASNNNSLGVLLGRVAVAGSDGSQLASVPSAGVDIDWWSLLTGSVVPTGLTLIEPKIQVRYAAGKGLVVKAGAGEASAQPGHPEPSALLAGLVASIGGAGNTAGAISALHIRNASVSFGEATEARTWSVPKFDFHRDSPAAGAAIVVGAGSILAPGGPTNATISIEQDTGAGQVRVTTSLDRFVPADLAGLSPALLPLAPALLPVGGEASMAFDAGGALAQLDMKVGLGKGQLDIGGACADSFRLDQGGLHIKYARGTGRVELLPSMLTSNGSTATVSGLALVSHDAEGRDRWQYNLELANVSLADPAHGLAPQTIDTWNARGTFTPSTGEAVLDRMALQAGSARMAMAGRISPAGLDAEARVQAADPGVVLRLWPACFQTYARDWVLANVRSGKISTGHMRMALDAAALERLRATGKAPDEAATAEFAVDDLAFTYADGLPPVLATHGDMRFAGRRFTASMPEAASQMPSGQVLTLTNAQYEVADFLDPSPRGRIRLDAAGPIETGLEFLNAKPLGLVSASGLRFTDLSGEFSGKLDLELPVTRLPAPGDIAVKAAATLKGLKLKRTIGGYALQGGTVDLEASESSLRADGDLLINGVAAKVLWSRQLGEGSGPPPPIRIAATLDANDRAQLGIAASQMVTGDVPVTVDLAAGPDDGTGRFAHVEANLTGAEMALDTLAWKKPAGEAAIASFDVATGDKGRTRLEDFKLSGDKVAISGEMELGPDNRLAAFHFPNFSINVVSQLDVSGKLRADKVMEVAAKGRFFDGRDFFRSLFAIGKITARQTQAAATAGGVDVTADVESVLGYGQVSLHAVHLYAERRQGQLTALRANGALDGGQRVTANLDHQPGQPRYLLADTGDAGRAFSLIGLYQGLVGGYAQLKVGLDGDGASQKPGTLLAKHFVLLGDQLVNEVLSDATKPAGGKAGALQRESFDFDRLQVQFSVGEGQLVLHDMFIHGPVLGATMRGRIDYGRQTLQLGGTYIPLYGLNSMFGALPLFGPLLVGRSGEGLLGITFAVEGPLAKPEVIVNPVSVVAPGIFRQIFEIGPEASGASSGPASAPQDGAQGQGASGDIGDAFPPVSADEAAAGLPPSTPVR